MALYNFKNHKKGDTFDGVEFTITVNGNSLILTEATIKMDMRETPLGVVVKSFSTPTSGITISSPTTAGKFIIDQQIIDIPAFKYYYDIEISLATNPVEIKTYVWGRWEIVQDITYD